MYMDKQTNLAFYRKYRPTSFDEVIGQDHITKPLKAQVKNSNPSHAYLFSGGRGIGKTTIARILANELGVSQKDIYEIDAASHTGVDDVRDIKESAYTLPFESKYKVYIFDEVHMLSKSAFNALLKILEEPPSYVIFMLATTEPEKIPDTVISRCETYNLKQPTKHILVDVLKSVAKKEKRNLENGVYELVATLANGSFRDALGILQKILNSSENKTISVEFAEELTGAPKTKLLNDLLKAMTDKKIEEALAVIGSVVSLNADIIIFQQLFLERFRTVLLLKYAPDLAEKIKAQYTQDDFEFLSSVANSDSEIIKPQTLLKLIDTELNTKIASIKHLPFELAIIDILDN